MRKKSICWNITSKCNANCEFCYRFISEKENNLIENKKILDILVKLKIKKITWSGGECLLYPNIIELLKIAHENNIENNLITNGKCLTFEMIDELEKYLNYITFSVDSIDDDLNEKIGRGKNHFKNIEKLINYIVTKNKNIIIKINSVITNKNKNEFINLANKLKDKPIKRWKIFKFIPLRGTALKNKEKYNITTKEFDNTIKEIVNKKLPFEVIGCKNKDFEKNYILVNPNGDFVITKDGKDKILINYNNINIEEVKEILKNGF